MNKKKVLITGSGGFIFGNFVRRAIYGKYPYQFISIDKLNNNNAMNSFYWNKNHTFHIADIRDQHIINTIFQFEKPDIVIHGAAETSVDNSLIDNNSFISSNIDGTQIIINSCLKYGVEKLIYISTDEVYGQLINEQEPSWDENSPLNPRNPYAATKASGELLVKAAHTAHGLIYNIVRSSNNYGPRQTPEKLIPKAIKCILEGKNIPIYGRGLQVRDWLHVFDNCSAILNILEKGKPNEIYNISANQEFNNIEVINEVCKYLNKGFDLITFVDDPRGSAHDFRYSINSNKIKELGWIPQFKFKKDIGEQCIKWYIDNQWFLK